MNKIVIISAEFYPRNTPRANRTTELAKELARQGNQVTIYTDTDSNDYVVYEENFNLNIKSIGKVRFATTNSKISSSKYSFFIKVLSKLFNRLTEFPDIELMFKAYSILKNNREQFDLLISIAYPFPIHWGVAYAKNRVKCFPNKWIADCGDPFMGNPNIKRPFYFKNIEKWFCKKTDFITVPTEQALNAYYPEFREKIEVIPQGFHLDDYKDLVGYTGNKMSTFIYAGAFYKNIRDPRPFLKYLISLEYDFKFIIYTKNRNIVEPFLNKLGDKLEIRDFIPRKEILQKLAKADFLINFQNKDKVQTPSKLIDYAIVERPVLNIKNKTDYPKIKKFLSMNYEDKMDIPSLENYSISNVAIKFVRLIN